MEHLTYLFGAGASCKALPLDNALINRLEEIITIGRNLPVNDVNQRYLRSFEDNYSDIIKMAREKGSLDTLANLSFRKPDLVNNIKNLIWIYFSANSDKGEIDNRYTKLIAKIRNRNATNFAFRNDVSLLTWNYDLQIEEAISTIDGIHISKVADKFYTYPGFELISKHKMLQNSNPDTFSLVHLNGCAGYYYDINSRSFHSCNNLDLTDPVKYNTMLNIVVQNFNTNTIIGESVRNSITFAFEENYYSNQAKKYAKEIAKKTTHLVIIGYSLADFNREVDREILNEMTNLKYISIQNPSANELKSKLLQISNTIGILNSNDSIEFHIENNDEINEFHFPGNF